ncbi:MAG TPA: diaminopimelate epimerase [Acidimicrobiales bacterium]|jgi:diaminopimelate epimerase|nr:diaminopimelate epimerase [Acidimicrobiales bacterium]
MRDAAPLDVLEKWHGAGNDFLVALRRSGPPRLDADHARRWCDRHTGIGADGLIEGTFDERGLVMSLHNADGSRAELSGNGLRCLVAAAVAHGLVAEGTLDVATDAGARRVTVALDPSCDRAWGSVDMGPVEVADGGSLESGVAAHLGNPHVVVADRGGPDESLLERAADLAGDLADDAGSGANVEFVTLDGPDHLTIRVVERGVGRTLACGTGSCAAAAVAHRLGLVSSHVTVTNPGGDLDVTLVDGAATLAGPAVRVAAVSMPEPW